MLQSKLFTKTRKDAPKDEVSKNARLLIRGGFIHKEMAGVYSYLPLGLRVFKKIEDIIREEMNAIGGQELLLTTLQDPEIWKKTNRWAEEEVDPQSGLPWFKTKLAQGGELGIANTHEEVLTHAMTQHVSSYKDLPVYVYQIQNKFRNELRAKSGIMRTREFVMKDLYSFSKSEEEFKKFYEECAQAYLNIFKRCGIGEKTFRTFASGGAFSKFSDEFQTISDAGEDIIYIDNKKGIAINEEVYTDEVISDLGLDKNSLRKEKSIEVGNIFPLGTKYTEAFGLTYKDKNGEETPIVMGSYGIGLGRLLGTIVEVTSDEDGIVWPESIAPFTFHIIVIGGEKVLDEAKSLYNKLKEKGKDVLLDDRAETPGTKFSDADLLGIPYRVVVSEKMMQDGKVELKKRSEKEVQYITKETLFEI